MWFLGVPIARALAYVGWRLRVVREAPLPSGPLVIATNHLSHLDGPMVAVAIGRPIRFLAVDGLWGVHRWLNALLYLIGPIPLSRDRPPLGAMKASIRHLRSGGAIGIFPEGGVTSEWGSVEPHPAAASLSLRTGAPLIPVAVSGTDLAYGLGATRVRRSRVQVTVGSPIEPGDFREVGEEAASAMMSAWTEWVSGALGDRAGE